MWKGSVIIMDKIVIVDINKNMYVCVLCVDRFVWFCSLRAKHGVLTVSPFSWKQLFWIQSSNSQHCIYSSVLGKSMPASFSSAGSPYITERTANPLSASNWRAGADCWINSKPVQRSPAPSPHPPQCCKSALRCCLRSPWNKFSNFKAMIEMHRPTRVRKSSYCAIIFACFYTVFLSFTVWLFVCYEAGFSLFTPLSITFPPPPPPHLIVALGAS